MPRVQLPEGYTGQDVEDALTMLANPVRVGSTLKESGWLGKKLAKLFPYHINTEVGELKSILKEIGGKSYLAMARSRPASAEESMPASSTTGDIIWKKLDPKTFYLYNEPSEEQPAAENPAQQQPVDESAISALSGKTFSPMEQEMFRRAMLDEGPTKAQLRAIHHWHFRQFADLNHDLRDNPDKVDVQSRIQEMMDSHALWIDKNGDLFTSIPLGKDANQRILDAAKLWQPKEEPDVDTQSIGQGIEQNIINVARALGASKSTLAGEGE